MRASVKRLVWALGWYLLWIFNDLVLIVGNSETVQNPYYQFSMFFIWIVPLLLFRDDKPQRRAA